MDKNYKRRNTDVDLGISMVNGTARKRSKKQHNIKEDEVNKYIDEYFEELERNQRGVSGMMNSELVKNIIAKFNKIFQMWDENPYFQQSLDSTLFEDLHKKMSNVFNINEHNNTTITDDILFTLTCKLCGKAFPLRNKDCSYSYYCHETSEEHKEFLKNDQMETASIRLYDQFFIYVRCYLCSEQIPIKAKDDAVTQHLKSSSHRKNSKLFRDNQHHVEDLCWKNNVFKCKLCHEQYFVDEFAQHFKSDHNIISEINDMDVEVDDILEKMCC